MVPAPQSAILDVGCGTGENARELKRRFPGARFDAVTHAHEEAERVRDLFSNVWCGDLEQGLPGSFRDYSAILCIHVLEHLREPGEIVMELARRLVPGGALVIAVPNVAHYGQRLSLLRGSWAYSDFGPLDWTHVRFFTFESAPRHLMLPDCSLVIEQHVVSPSIPLGRLRRVSRVVPLYEFVERKLSAAWPNLFGWQVLIRASRPVVD